LAHQSFDITKSFGRFVVENQRLLIDHHNLCIELNIESSLTPSMAILN
jgi:hypothetical protein